jgi:predicted acylesterase/phospholipase RssA
VDLGAAVTRPDGPIARPSTFNVLVLSGGGAYGAYSVGVLAGWSEAGTRPEFDVVTGVSTGALIATLAFLGSGRDPDLKRFYTHLTNRDLFVRRPSLSALLSDALADSRPLERLIEQAVDADLLRQVSIEHAKGRRLYVGTTQLDARRLVVWDMGAIASRGRARDLALFRQVLLASASLPGLLPPVSIPVDVDGKQYEEMHVDGGVTASLFFRPPQAPRDRVAALGDRPLAGSNVYVVVAGKLYCDPDGPAPVPAHREQFGVRPDVRSDARRPEPPVRHRRGNGDELPAGGHPAGLVGPNQLDRLRSGGDAQAV